MDFVVHGRSKLVQGEIEPSTCGAEASTAVIEHCGVTKPVVTRLTPVMYGGHDASC